MPVTPRWWYERRARSPWAIRALLTPISWVWAWATARRIARAQAFDPGVPVICVGNLTMGGSGKTPVAAAVARHLIAAGQAPHVLMRGHGGRRPGPLRVDPAVHSADEVGDEALMLAGELPVWVARDRAAGARAAVAAGASVLVMDDGHQNGALAKTVSLIVVDGETRGGEWPFGEGGVFPAGPLREPFAAGLSRADSVVILLPADLPAPDPELASLFEGKPVVTAWLVHPEPPPTGPQMAFAGVGKPWRVERALTTAGCDLADFVAFADHAALDEPALDCLAARAAALGAGLLTTEKDWVRLPARWRAAVRAWPARVVFEEGDRDRLISPLL
jgi:tetraacyldisaccharide 4'-kinase